MEVGWDAAEGCPRKQALWQRVSVKVPRRLVLGAIAIEAGTHLASNKTKADEDSTRQKGMKVTLDLSRGL